MSEASLNAKLHKGAHSRLKAEIDSLKKWREDHYPKVSSLSLIEVVLPSVVVNRRGTYDLYARITAFVDQFHNIYILENVWWVERCRTI